MWLYVAVAYWFALHLWYVPLTNYLVQVRPLEEKKMGMDGREILLFPQEAAEHAYGGDILKGKAGKGRS